MANRLAVNPDVELSYSEIIQLGDLSVPFVPAVITPRIEKPLRSGRYERGERSLLADVLRPSDRVLDLGGGLGIVAATAARHVDQGHVLCIEAQPNLIPFVRNLWAENGIQNAEIRHGLVGATEGEAADFFIRKDFWASSFEATSRPFLEKVSVPSLQISDLIASFRPTVISCDIEGAEATAFDDVDLSGVRCIVLETHPKVYGEAERTRLLLQFAKIGLMPRPQKTPSTVFVLERLPDTGAPRPSLTEISKTAARVLSTRTKPPAPRVLIITGMKNEAPYILEWVAWHKAIGVTDFVIFSNHCSDGTDTILDRLDELGEITHLPNPAPFVERRDYQPMALYFAQSMPVFRRADYVISMDVDEFINVRVPGHRLSDLFSAVPEFDALSISELNHGSNGHKQIEDGWVTSLFPGHITEDPRDRRARTGVKTITRRSELWKRIGNHRPFHHDGASPVWLDGSGKALTDLSERERQNGLDCRGRFNLVSLDHFALRSVDAFLIKHMRGDTVSSRRNVDGKYWRVRNRAEARTSDLTPGQALAREVYRRFENDETLMRLHQEALVHHQRMAVEATKRPELVALRDWIYANAWDAT